jgi:hypothetical protein
VRWFIIDLCATLDVGHPTLALVPDEPLLQTFLTKRYEMHSGVKNLNIGAEKMPTRGIGHADEWTQPLST